MAKEKISKPGAFIWGMLVGMILLALTQQSGIMNDFWDYIEFGETNVIKCDDVKKWHEEESLTTEWNEASQRLYDYAMVVCK